MKESLAPTPKELQENLLRCLPKVELHRHLEGSMRLETIRDLCKQLNIHIQQPDTLEAYRAKFVITKKVANLKQFLDKMWFAQSLLASNDIIERVTFECCEDAFMNGVKLLEIRYSPSWIAVSSFNDHSHLSLGSIHDAVVKGIIRAQRQFDIKIGLILGLDRTMSLDSQSKCLDFFMEEREDGFIMGIDLANDEQYSCIPFADLYRKAREFGLGLTCHAGESTNAQSVMDSISHLHVKRIGHGFLSIHDPKLVELLVRESILLEICPISNVRTGSVPSMQEHPVRKLMDAGVKICISTDDPGMFGATILDEYRILEKEHGFTKEEFMQCNRNALHASFLPSEIKQEVMRKHFEF